MSIIIIMVDKPSETIAYGWQARETIAYGSQAGETIAYGWQAGETRNAALVFYTRPAYHCGVCLRVLFLLAGFPLSSLFSSDACSALSSRDEDDDNNNDNNNKIKWNIE